MEFRQTKKFINDFKRLKKKYKSLDDDLTLFCRVLTKTPEGPASRNWALLKTHKHIQIFKARLACRYLKKKSLRIVYAYHQNSSTIELLEFMELFIKSEQTREDMQNIEKYLADY
jgi:mRNA-degrading endonuclease YafQ of YafQ-DinJ toxin-antitoxin module